jgi:hypothetical protein
MEQGEKLNRVLLHSTGYFNLDIDLGRAAFREILEFFMLTWGGGGSHLGTLILMLEGCMKGMQCNVEFCYQLSICSWTEENHGKP